MVDEDDQDVYVAQLREVFDSCDVKGDGFLTKDGLVELCQKLQLEDQLSKLLAQLLGDQEDGEVNFEEFKEGFVIVLSDAIDGLTVSSEEEQLEVEEPPKLVVNEKRYGRRSRPFDSRLSEDGSADEGDVESINGSRPPSPEAKPTLEKHRRIENGDVEDAKVPKERRLSRANSQKLRRRESLRKRDSLRRQESVKKRSLPRASEEEILEASGQISSNTKWSPHQSFNNSAVSSPTEEQQLRTIWNEVSVGANGFLDKHELSVVCEHIGMEGMDEEELSVLFDELDDDRDGQVSFEEFLHGLFIAKDKSQLEFDLPSYSDAVIDQVEKPRSHSGARNHGEPLTSTRTVRTIEANLLQVLDPENIGMAKVEDIKDLWSAQENTEALKLLKHTEVDSEGKVSLSQLTALLESSIYEKSDSVCQAVVGIFKHELTFMRSQVESLNVEKEKLIENASHLVNDKDILIRESEDHTRQLELQHEAKLRECEEASSEKWLLEKQQLLEEHEKTVAASSKKLQEFEARIERYKAEELRSKQKLGESEEEIGRLDSTLNETQESLDESEKVRARLEKELGKVANLNRKLAEVESQRDLLKQQQNQNATRGIRELEKLNRELRDENDELQSQMEVLKSQAKSGLKRNRSHRRRTTDRITRVGSVLSDYTKPVIIKRNKDGVTSSEDSEVDLVDGNSPPVRVGGDGGSNEDENKVAAINSEQRKTIEDLEGKLTEHEAKIKELENTIRQQDQNMKAKNASITKQKTSVDKLRTEAKEKDGDITEKMHIIEKLSSDLKTKEEELCEHKGQVTQLQEAQKKSDSTIREKETVIKNLNSEVESLQRLSTSENSEIKDRFNKELSNLTSQFTTEMGEMQQRFSLEKEEMEQEFLVKCKELEADYERKNAESVSELKACFEDEKDLLVSETGVEKSELESEFQKQKQMLEKFYAEEMEGEKRKHSEEMAKLEEIIEVLQEEKKQFQTFFEKEKVDIEEQFAAEKAEIDQEKLEMEKRFSAELEKERERFVREKTDSTADYEEVKKALEERFNRDKLTLQKNFARQKLELETTVEELRQVFAKGVAGLKGKLKDDFMRLLSEHKEQVDDESEALKVELEKMRQDSASEREETKRLEEEVDNLKDELQLQIDTTETRFNREREILELEMREKSEEAAEKLRRLRDQIASLTEENIQLQEHARELDSNETVAELEETRNELEDLTREIEKLREAKGGRLSELEDAVARLRAEKERVLENGVENSALLEEQLEELQAENARLKRHGDELAGDSCRKCAFLERQVQSLENGSSEMRRSHTRLNSEQKREVERLRRKVEELEDTRNRRNEKVLLVDKARKELCALEKTVQEMEKEKQLLENSLYQQNIKNTSFQDEIADLKRRHMNAENRFKKELDLEKEKINLVNTEMSTARSKYLRELDEVRDKLDRALSNNERDQSMRDKILNGAKAEIVTLSNKLEEKAKRCRDIEEERLTWEERVRQLDRQRREMELRIKKTQDSVDEHVMQLSKQLQDSQARSLRTDTLVQELYIENARLTKTVQEVECAQKKAEKGNRQLLEQKRALQRVISKLCGANALA